MESIVDNRIAFSFPFFKIDLLKMLRCLDIDLENFKGRYI